MLGSASKWPRFQRFTIHVSSEYKPSETASWQVRFFTNEEIWSAMSNETINTSKIKPVSKLLSAHYVQQFQPDAWTSIQIKHILVSVMQPLAAFEWTKARDYCNYHTLDYHCKMILSYIFTPKKLTQSNRNPHWSTPIHALTRQQFMPCLWKNQNAGLT